MAVDRAGLRELLAAAEPIERADVVEETGSVTVIRVGGVWALAHCGAPELPQAWTDARLIAAAVNALPELLDALDTAERERDQALAALARIERGEAATPAERAASTWWGTNDYEHGQAIAAAARHTIGGTQ
ncbi:hypothetical protein BBK14_11425 [Parafrankia soli]|uniref:Uncharacterized protein n=1 Tax=Parafrankia soli TaxID=2599596 RepID=A0A1S1RBR9_9ACTN|nr:hypothetical protein [Parafrankia soli]OHV42224.1 hypothetical protein BBK14_11425 [Parafrankia soli]